MHLASRKAIDFHLLLSCSAVCVGAGAVGAWDFFSCGWKRQSRVASPDKTPFQQQQLAQALTWQQGHSGEVCGTVHNGSSEQCRLTALSPHEGETGNRDRPS